MRVAVVCPKCQRERLPGVEACARCGLLVERWEAFVRDLESHPVIDAGWAALSERWEDADAHRRFLELSADAGALDLAAARYREARRQRPGDARAETGLKRTASLAENLHASKAHGERAYIPGAWLRVVGYLSAGVVVLGLAAGLMALFRR